MSGNFIESSKPAKSKQSKIAPEGTINAADLLQKLSSFPATGESGEFSTGEEMALHVAALNPHSQYALKTELSKKADKNSPALTGVPTADTPDALDDSTRLATTSFVQQRASSVMSALEAHESAIEAHRQYVTADYLSIALNTKADLASPSFYGVPKTPTPSLSNKSTQIANMEIVQRLITLNTSGGEMADHLDAENPHPQYAPINSPSFLGFPTAPNPDDSDNSTRLATTASVHSLVNSATSSLATIDSPSFEGDVFVPDLSADDISRRAVNAKFVHEVLASETGGGGAIPEIIDATIVEHNDNPSAHPLFARIKDQTFTGLTKAVTRPTTDSSTNVATMEAVHAIVDESSGGTEFDIGPHKIDPEAHAGFFVKTESIPVFNIIDYGGIGDGVFDNCDAFDACILAAGNSSGSVFIPPGDFYTTKDIVLTGVSTLFGVSIPRDEDLPHRGKRSCITTVKKISFQAKLNLNGSTQAVSFLMSNLLINNYGVTDFLSVTAGTRIFIKNVYSMGAIKNISSNVFIENSSVNGVSITTGTVTAKDSYISPVSLLADSGNFFSINCTVGVLTIEQKTSTTIHLIRCSLSLLVNYVYFSGSATFDNCSFFSTAYNYGYSAKLEGSSANYTFNNCKFLTTSQTAMYGIYISSASVYLNNCSVSCYVANADGLKGVIFQSGGSLFIVDSIITNAFSSSSEPVINAQNFTMLSISGTTIKRSSNSGSGIVISAAAAVVSNLSIKNCSIIINNNFRYIDITKSGLPTDGRLFLNIKDNYLSGNSGVGISINGGAAFGLISGNLLKAYNLAKVPIRVNISGNVSVFSNINSETRTYEAPNTLLPDNFGNQCGVLPTFDFSVAIPALSNTPVKLPNGIIFQFGVAPPSVAGVSDVTFDLAFPNSCLFVFPFFPGENPGMAMLSGMPTKTGCIINTASGSFSLSGEVSPHYMAIGL